MVQLSKEDKKKNVGNNKGKDINKDNNNTRGSVCNTMKYLRESPQADIHIDPESGYIIPRERPIMTEGITVCRSVGCGHIFITINSDDEGLCEIFATLGKSGGCPTAMLEAITRLSSILLRCYVDPQALIKQFRGIRCPSPLWDNGTLLLSCPDAIAQTIEQYVFGMQPRKPDVTPQQLFGPSSSNLK